MSGGGLVEVLAEVLAERLGDPHGAVDHMLARHNGMVPSECRCRGCGRRYAEPTGSWTDAAHGLAAHQWQMLLADVVTAHLAARLEGCRFEVRGAVVAHNEAFARSWAITEAALAVVREALGLPPETQGAALSASDGADGPEGHRQATRAGDGL